MMNRWFRLGAVASVIWAIAAAVHVHSKNLEQAKHAADLAYNVCVYGQEVRHNNDRSSCMAERDKSMAIWMESDTKEAIFVALAPVPIAWLTVFISAYVIRAQIAGFRAVLPWKSLSSRKKGYVVLCATYCLLLAGLATLWVGNLYVESKVPVGMSTFLDVNQYGDNVYVSGTWTRTDLTDDSISYPLQTSKIECHRDTNRCTEAVASVSGSTLMSDLVSYDIRSWSRDSIVMERDYECSTELFTIDLNTKSVSGAGHRTNQETTGCRTGISDKSTWTYQLVKGFDVYWALRSKARPLPVRMIDALFGN